MANISYTDKSQVQSYDPSKWNAQDANEVKTAVNSKQDSQAGKGLSTNDYTTSEKTKLAGIATGATANSTDAQLRDRSTHTGTQAISTITSLQSSLDNKTDLLKYTKTAHGFGVGWLVYPDSSGVWQRSNADVNDAESRGGVIVSVPDANTFVIGPPGTKFSVSGLSLPLGPHYLAVTTTFTANYTATAPTGVGQVEREIFHVVSTTEAVVTNTQYLEIAAAVTPTVNDGTITDNKLASDNKVGSLSALITSDKSSIVAAMNETRAILNGLGNSSGGSGIDKDYISLPVLTTPGSFTVNVISSTELDLSWTDISGEVHYILQRSTTSNAGFSTIATLNPGTTSYNDTNRTAATTYYYRLKAEGDGWTTRDSQWTFANGTTSAGGGSPTVEQEILLNFVNQYSGTEQYSSVENIRDTSGTAVAAGTAGETNVRDTSSVVTTVDFTLTSAGVGVVTNLDGGADPNNTTVFGKQWVAAQSWLLNDNGTFKLSGLTASRGYKLYFWSYCPPWENRIVYFSANGTDTTNVSAHGNTGDASGDPLQDSALRVITVNSDGSGEILMTAHFVSSTSGSTGVPLTALYIQRLSS